MGQLLPVAGGTRGPDLLPVTVGGYSWHALSNAGTGGEQVWNLIVTGSFISVVPLVAAFLSLQKCGQGGLSLGNVRRGGLPRTALPGFKS